MAASPTRSVGERGSSRGGALEILSQVEWVVPDAADSMVWSCSDLGMEMVLARDVPERSPIFAPFVEPCSSKGRAGGCARTRGLRDSSGRPRSRQIAAGLGLTESQVAFSRAVLREHGNMSSATLPHVGQAIAASPRVADGELVVSLAFGPGLTLSGAVLRKASAC